MTFPFEALASVSRQAGLVVAVLIGVAFGFVLERAGFGRATKLAAQFYLRDMTVFKVMFSAIVTAMLGLVAVAGFGLADLRAISESISSWTYVWPMLVGGLVLGAGFIISGYCPGTSIVAGASGNIDGMFTVAGVVTGTFVYSELMQIASFARFHDSGDKGAWFLYDLVPLPPQVLAVAVAIMAIGAFAGAEKVERMIAGGSTFSRPAWLRFAVPAFAALSVLAVVTITIAVPQKAEASSAPRTIGTAELAKRVIAEPWRYQIADGKAFDLSANETLAIAGGQKAWDVEPLVVAMRSGAAAAPAPAVPRPTGVIAKPKKKGGGCSA